MVTTRRMEKKKSKEKMGKDEEIKKKNGIREFTIKLNRLTIENSTAFKDASFKLFGIRDLFVKVERDSREAFTPCIPKLKLVTSNRKTVRSLVPWLPTTASVKHTSTERPKPTTDQFHSELLQKVNSPNRSLRKVNQQSDTTLIPRVVPTPEWKKIFDEFQQQKAKMGKSHK